MDTISPEVAAQIQLRLDLCSIETADELVLHALKLFDDQLALERELLKGLHSGEGIPADKAFFDAHREQLIKRHHLRQS